MGIVDSTVVKKKQENKIYRGEWVSHKLNDINRAPYFTVLCFVKYTKNIPFLDRLHSNVTCKR